MAEDRDEFGLPRAWRYDIPQLIAASEEHWPTFDRWCTAKGFRSFPASPETVLRFLIDPPVRGELIYKTWQAVHKRHGGHYWHTDADPVRLCELGGVKVHRDGSVEIPEKVLRMFGLSIPDP